ncbi:nuclear transport factor 2 family protein [Ktedonosporobacter rubrisoli]|uniref:Nuclear transport factor 2 family protein n=1 Tax=Ktedonosporobacter rubrisoli TaxID=2509675 RepID=A0A4P6JIY3_KTERU|nr:nuclear transport factor 2 family protein [Ktedonosporobacter rubrisoli]QBD74616.1 nuclear transport factor 2 family protein [Ktedonosporobacter rubrisoli]
MSEERLREFIKAWIRQDIEAVMSFIAEECIYETSTGPEPGQTYVGKEAIRKKFIEVLADDGDGELQIGLTFVHGDKGLSEWRYDYTDAEGRVIPQHGCDVFEFVGDKISRKSVFRKTYA